MSSICIYSGGNQADVTMQNTDEQMLFRFRCFLIPVSLVVLGAIMLVLGRAVKNHKPTDVTPYLFIWTLLFLFIANASLLLRISLRLAGNQLVASRTSRTMTSLVFITHFGIAAAYWIFAQRYWQLSLKLHELKHGKRLKVQIVEQPLNIAMWILIFIHSATV